MRDAFHACAYIFMLSAHYHLSLSFSKKVNWTSQFACFLRSHLFMIIIVEGLWEERIERRKMTHGIIIYQFLSFFISMHIRDCKKPAYMRECTLLRVRASPSHENKFIYMRTYCSELSKRKSYFNNETPFVSRNLQSINANLSLTHSCSTRKVKGWARERWKV
jgi:hypothetical protein